MRAWQFGEQGSLDISAYMVAAELGYTFFDAPLTPHLWVGFDYATGDRHSDDGKLNTFDEAMYWGNLAAGLFAPTIFFHFCLTFHIRPAFLEKRGMWLLLYAPSAFLLLIIAASAEGLLKFETPLFEVRDANMDRDKRGMLVINAALGDALAATLGVNPVVLMRGHGETVVGRSVREATVRTLYTHIDAQAQSAAMALNPNIKAMDAAELAFNSTENFDADRPWQGPIAAHR